MSDTMTFWVTGPDGAPLAWQDVSPLSDRTVFVFESGFVRPRVERVAIDLNVAWRGGWVRSHLSGGPFIVAWLDDITVSLGSLTTEDGRVIEQATPRILRQEMDRLIDAEARA